MSDATLCPSCMSAHAELADPASARCSSCAAAPAVEDEDHDESGAELVALTKHTVAVEFDGVALSRSFSAPSWVPASVFGAGALGALAASFVLGWPTWIGAAAAMGVTLFAARYPVDVGEHEAVHHGLIGNATNTRLWLRWAPLGDSYRITLRPFVIDYEPAAVELEPGLALRVRVRVTLAARVDGGEVSFQALMKLDTWQHYPRIFGAELRKEVLRRIVAGVRAAPSRPDPGVVEDAVIAGFAELGCRVDAVEVIALERRAPESGAGEAVDRVFVEQAGSRGSARPSASW